MPFLLHIDSPPLPLAPTPPSRPPLNLSVDKLGTSSRCSMWSLASQDLAPQGLASQGPNQLWGSKKNKVSYISREQQCVALKVTAERWLSGCSGCEGAVSLLTVLRLHLLSDISSVYQSTISLVTARAPVSRLSSLKASQLARLSSLKGSQDIILIAIVSML